MNETKNGNPSHAELNRHVRVLSATRLKYTIQIHLNDSRTIEFQSNRKPFLAFLESARELWLVDSDYDKTPIMRWPDGAIILTEENPT